MDTTEKKPPGIDDSQNRFCDASTAPHSDGRGVTGLTPAEIRVRAKDAHSTRMETLKGILSPRSYQQLLNIPSNLVGRYSKALLGELSAIQAIRAKCEECVGWSDIPERVGDCRSRSCPLWTTRPYQDHQGKHPITSYLTYHD